MENKEIILDQIRKETFNYAKMLAKGHIPSKNLNEIKEQFIEPLAKTLKIANGRKAKRMAKELIDEVIQETLNSIQR